MIKSVREIEQDVVLLIKDSVIGKAVNGKVYLLENVPANAKPEYITVAHLTGTTELTQKGVCIVNIIMQGIPYDGRLVANGNRIKHLCNLVQEMIWDYSGTYTLTTDGNPETMLDEDTNLYYINVRLAYSRRCN